MLSEVTLEHFNHLSEAGTILTETFLRTQRVVTDCVKYQMLGVVYGEAGHGKTFAVDAALTSVELPVVKTLFTDMTTPREMFRQLISVATGSSRKLGTRYEMQDECIELLADPHVVIIDEAQNLNANCTQYLRTLVDHPQTNAALVLIGGNGCWERIQRDPMLASRVSRRVKFKAVPAGDLLKALPQYHPIYAGVDSDLLYELYHRCPISQLRTLAIFTHTAKDVCDEDGQDVLDERAIEKALVLIGDDDYATR